LFLFHPNEGTLRIMTPVRQLTIFLRCLKL